MQFVQLVPNQVSQVQPAAELTIITFIYEVYIVMKIAIGISTRSNIKILMYWNTDGLC